MAGLCVSGSMLFTPIAFAADRPDGFAADRSTGSGAAAVVRAEDPLVEELAADYVVEECRVTRRRALQILRVQDRSQAMDDPLRRLRPGVVTSYHPSCRPGMIVQVLRGTPRGPIRALARRHGIEKWLRFQLVRHTLRETYRAQRAISARLEGLSGRCLASTAQDTPGNGVSIELSTDATKADVALVRRAMRASPVPVSLTRLRGSLCVTLLRTPDRAL